MTPAQALRVARARTRMREIIHVLCAHQHARVIMLHTPEGTHVIETRWFQRTKERLRDLDQMTRFRSNSLAEIERRRLVLEDVNVRVAGA